MLRVNRLKGIVLNALGLGAKGEGWRRNLRRTTGMQVPF